jgi:uncharacterized protein (TIGR02246 family)
MKTQPSQITPPHGISTHELEFELVSLYRSLLSAWDRRDARAYASLFTPDGIVIGFDGSPMKGHEDIEAQLEQIFAGHRTATYVAVVRDARFLTPEVGLVSAVAGMIPFGEQELNPAVNAMQTMVALKHEGRLMIASFQNTPAALHGRPEMATQLTEELRARLRARPK